MSAIAHRIERVRSTLPSTTRLVAVTKYTTVAAMREAYAAGVRDFGESRIQEALPKLEALSDLPDITWHFIGHVQTNKARKVLEHFQWIHAADSVKLVERLDNLAAELERSPQLCLQVKVLPDPDKYGWTIPELLADLPALDRCQHVRIQGLMTILPLGLSAPEIQQAFHRLHQLADEIRQQPRSHIEMTELSMGMSGDYPLAVAAGATMVRLGSILFKDDAGH